MDLLKKVMDAGVEPRHHGTPRLRGEGSMGIRPATREYQLPVKESVPSILIV